MFSNSTSSPKLRVSIVEEPFITTFNGSLKGYERLSGIDGDFFNVIAQHLGLDYEIIVDQQRGKKRKDGNWTGMFGLLAKGEADMAIGLLSMDITRTEVVDFSTAYTVEAENLVIEKAYHDQTPLFAFLYTFDVIVWMCSILTVLLVALFFHRLSRNPTTFSDMVFKLFSSVLRQPIKANYNQKSVQMLLLFWLFFALVISVGYSAKLLSFLTVPLRRTQIKNFRQLFRAVKKGTHKCFAYEDSNILQFLNGSSNSYLKYLRDIILRKDWYVDNSTAHQRSIVTQNSGVITPGFIFEIYYTFPGYNSKYMRLREPLGIWPTGFAFSKNFCCKNEINAVILRLVSAGIQNKILSDVSFKLRLKDFEEIIQRDDAITKLAVEDILGPFLFLVIGYAFSTLVLLGEICFFYFARKIANYHDRINFGTFN